MINYLHSLLHRPENGWDPISQEYAALNSELEWGHDVNEALIDELDRWVGGLAGRRVLDLGGGPGHYSVAFAKRGAIVTWHDVSRAYREIAQRKATEQNVEITFAISYMDEVAQVHREPFDLVFSRICWCYCLNDYSFADVVFKLIKPGGVGYVDTNHSGARIADQSLSAGLRAWLNNKFAIKIGHPHPPHGRVAEAFLKKPISKMQIDYISGRNDRILFMKQK